MSRPKRIILIRHGQSEGNVDEEIYATKPDYALALTRRGHAEARRAGDELRALVGRGSCFFYVSPMWRTRMTFEEIARAFDPRQYQFIEEPRLREQEWGHFKTKPMCDVINDERDRYGTFYYRISDGESAADVFDRVSDFLGTLHRDFEKRDYPDNAVIVTHGMTIRLFLMRWFRWSVEAFEELRNPKNCQIVVMQRGRGRRYELIDTLERRKPKHVYQRPLRLPPRAPGARAGG